MRLFLNMNSKPYRLFHTQKKVRQKDPDALNGRAKCCRHVENWRNCQPHHNDVNSLKLYIAQASWNKFRISFKMRLMWSVHMHIHFKIDVIGPRVSSICTKLVTFIRGGNKNFVCVCVCVCFIKPDNIRLMKAFNLCSYHYLHELISILSL